MNIKDYNIDELKEEIAVMGFEKYRAEQLFKEIYVKRIESFSEMKLIPKRLNDVLMDKYAIDSIRSYKLRKSSDGSIKFLFTLLDGLSIETVYMPWESEVNGGIERITLCVSTQAGCPVGCAFCATASLGLKRNLFTSEIVDQILFVEKIINVKVNNLVFMGMGEPLLNFDNVIKAIDILTMSENNLLNRRRITLSTAGVVKRIYELTSIPKPVKLAISLHSTTSGTRSHLMPISKSHSINKIMDAVEFYYRKTKMNITYEYILFDGINDSYTDAVRLSRIAKRVPSRVNIIPFNDISFTQLKDFSATLKPASGDSIARFAEWLREMGTVVIVRKTYGSDIEAACGQLALADEVESS